MYIFHCNNLEYFCVAAFVNCLSQNFFTEFLKWYIVHLVFYPVLLVHVYGNFSHYIYSN